MKHIVCSSKFPAVRFEHTCINVLLSLELLFHEKSLQDKILIRIILDSLLQITINEYEIITKIYNLSALFHCRLHLAGQLFTLEVGEQWLVAFNSVVCLLIIIPPKVAIAR